MARGRVMVGGAGESERIGGEYQVVSVRPSAGAISLALAVVSLLSSEIVRHVFIGWLGWRPTSPWSWPLALFGTSISASALGLLIAWISLRRRPRASRSLPWLGVIANGTVFGLLLLMALAFTIIRFG